MTVKQICRHFAVHRLVVHNNNIRSVGFLVGYDHQRARCSCCRCRCPAHSTTPLVGAAPRIVHKYGASTFTEPIKEYAFEVSIDVVKVNAYRKLTIIIECEILVFPI